MKLDLLIVTLIFQVRGPSLLYFFLQYIVFVYISYDCSD